MPAALTATAQDIVTGALRLIRQVDANQPTPPDQMQDGLEALNFLVKSYQSQGLHLWTKEEGILFLDVGKKDYLLGPTGDESCQVDDFISTELSVAGTTSALTITVDSSTGMAVDDKIGILLDSGTRQWTTIKSIPAATPLILTLTDALDGAAAVNKSVFTFTTLISRPVRILQLRRDKIGDVNEIESAQWTREEYFAQTDKSGQGDLVNWYYDPKLTNGRLYVWQTTNDADKVARFTYEEPLDITDDTTDNVDFPSEWFRTLKYQLAVDIAPEYSVDADVLDRVTLRAEQLLGDSLGFDVENDSMYYQPELH